MRTQKDSGPTSSTKNRTQMGYRLSKAQTDSCTVILHQRLRSSTTSFTRSTLKRISQHAIQRRQSDPTMDNIHVGVNGVCKLLKGLNVHKATGPDAVSTRFLHDFAVELAPIMTKLFQLSLDTGKIPDDWREASIVPAFKKGERQLASNYRPVSLTSVSCKLLGTYSTQSNHGSL